MDVWGAAGAVRGPVSGSPLAEQKLGALNTEISSLTAALEQQAQETSGLREQVEKLRHSVPEGPALTDWSVAPVSVDPDRRELTIRVSVTPAEGRDIRVDRAVAHRPDVDSAENQQWPGAYSFDEMTDGTIYAQYRFSPGHAGGGCCAAALLFGI